MRLDDPRGTGGNPYNRRTVLWVVALTSFLIPFMASSINVALPTIGKEFKIDAILLGWIATSYILSCAVFTVPFGRLADIYGRKKIFTLGILCYTVFSLSLQFVNIYLFFPLFSSIARHRQCHGICHEFSSFDFGLPSPREREGLRDKCGFYVFWYVFRPVPWRIFNSLLGMEEHISFKYFFGSSGVFPLVVEDKG